ncbi:hypothetical protein [Egicoccus halophilus]|uniref:NurA domain-containing protein n=1 Tax=Egicoccus halophilus TaxID=1670830 RepID=A0A8J3A9H5_9ACTN|nr:hypothetical protein [Egicoccus halophilus]GGI05508.1 hypothetical protein GCM10011354_14450 [Egicoccus halophilus]
MRLAVDSWSPEFGAPGGGDDLPTGPGEVDPTVEVPVDRWAPRAPATTPDVPVGFVDGVRRVEGVVWGNGDGPDGEVRQAAAVSIAAGAVCCAGERATITSAEVQRLLVGPAGFAPLTTRAGRFEPRAVADDDPAALQRGMQERLRRLERRLLDRLRWPDEVGEIGLLVLDGPLDGSVEVDHAIGYVKSHHVAYLPEEVRHVVGALLPGQRTPLFLAQSSWTRFSWYLRLPYGGEHPWAGIVRCEASADVGVGEAARLADLAAARLPRFASRPHKDRRAPQNLYPIAGLERHLKRLLGDGNHVLRALREAAADTRRAAS